MTRTSTMVVALLSLFVTTTAINAAEQDARARHGIAVSYSDLDLSQPAGARTLLARLQIAAKSACDRSFDERDMSTLWLYRDCNKQAMDNAVASVHSPLVAELYAPGRNGKGAPERLANSK